MRGAASVLPEAELKGREGLGADAAVPCPDPRNRKERVGRAELVKGDLGKIAICTPDPIFSSDSNGLPFYGSPLLDGRELHKDVIL